MSPKKIWNLIPPSPQAPRLALETGISRLKAQLLLNRNITDSDSAAIFLSPRLSHLADPMLLKDMDRAIDLVLKSVEKREPITVYGDYDADGLTATALLLNFFCSVYRFPSIFQTGWVRATASTPIQSGDLPREALALS